MFKKFFSGIFKQVPALAVNTQLDTALNSLARLVPVNFKHVHSSDLSIFRVTSFFPSIVTYTEFLNRVNEAFITNEAFPTFLLPAQSQSYFISDFFLDENGYYVDEVKVIGDFKIEAEKFIRFFLSEENNEQVNEFNHEHNLRILKKVFQDLSMLIEILSSNKFSL